MHILFLVGELHRQTQHNGSQSIVTLLVRPTIAPKQVDAHFFLKWLHDAYYSELYANRRVLNPVLCLFPSLSN